MSLTQATPLITELESLIAAGASSTQRINELISQLKRIIFVLPCNSTGTSQQQQVGEFKDELLASRRFHELCILYSIQSKNISVFESAINYLQVYYDENSSTLPVSQDRSQITALHLLYLLSFNRAKEYYCQLELLTLSEVSTSPYIKFVTQLEKQLAIGNYAEALRSKNKSPSVYFNLFLDRIFETIRVEIAKSAETAYDSLSLNEAQQLFSLETEDKLKEFIKAQEPRREKAGYNWTIEGNRLVFKHKDQDKQALFNSENLILTSLSYANEIERII